MPEPKQNGIVSFGVFQADLRAGELRRSGAKVKLQEQPFQVLAMLLERPGEIITREELRTRLWPADTFVDFDHGLNAAIKRLRDGLGDSAENPRFVETLARRGYRFIAPVSASKNGSESASDQKNISVPQTKRHWRIGLAAAGVLLMGTGAGWVAARHFNSKVEISQQRLTANPADDPVLNAVISPDGKYVAFADKAGLFLRVVATGETHSPAVPEGFRARPASWFPDGSHLLVTALAAPEESSSVWSISVFGGSPRKLADKAEGRAVSPDGSQIAFVRGGPQHQEIWLMSADGERPWKVFGETGDFFGPVAWSHDSSRFAFVRYVYKSGFHYSGDVSLWICHPGSGRAHSILSDVRLGESLAWAPDGRLIYSLSEPSSASPGLTAYSGDSNLWALQIDARTNQPVGEARRLTSGPDKKTGLSLSADGKRLTFLRWTGEAHVYVSQIEAGSRRLGPPRRLGLDEGRNLPFTWTPDGKSVIFTSDRDGPSHLFKQRVDQPVADLLVGGDDSVLMARLNPDSSEVFYLLSPRAQGGDNRTRLMRVPLSGGTPQLILQRDGIENFQCARLPSTLCVFGHSSAANGFRFSTFDPLTGDEKELISAGIGLKYNWSLSPDGSTLALAQWQDPQIQLLSTRGGAPRTLTVQGWTGVASIDWAADGQSLWTSSASPTGTEGLLNIDLHGRITPVFQDTEKDVGWAIPSPDGRRIALWEASRSSNAWLLQGF
jgi:DNA-binding winged helix-turn-helix (wHTH) protein/Tol biopolymer transport system component